MNDTKRLGTSEIFEILCLYVFIITTLNILLHKDHEPPSLSLQTTKQNSKWTVDSK